MPAKVPSSANKDDKRPSETLKPSISTKCQPDQHRASFGVTMPRASGFHG